jgi:6-phosphogluconolactonase (cycloisomerase 2 family)
MKTTAGRLLVLLAAVAGIGLCAKGQAGSPTQFVVLNDSPFRGRHEVPNDGTVFTFDSTSPGLKLLETLITQGKAGAPVQGLDEVAMVQQGTGACVYLTDAGSADVAAFVYPTFNQVGRNTMPNSKRTPLGLGLAARGNYLFTSYNGYNQASNYIATWKISAGCGLTFVTTLEIANNVTGMGISPDGRVLAVGYDFPLGSVDSFSVGSDGTLTEHGPWIGPFNSSDGVDITADSKFAIFAETAYGLGDPTQVGIYSINPDGSLGEYYTFGGDGSLGPGSTAQYVWLSPDEKFLYVSNNSGHVTTLNFNEAAHTLTYSGCSKRLKTTANGMATALPVGSGGFLYVARPRNGAADVALLQIDSITGCLTEVPGSPFSSGHEGVAESVAAWPPRPF